MKKIVLLGSCLLVFGGLSSLTFGATGGSGCLDLAAFEGTYTVDNNNCNLMGALVFGENPLLPRPTILANRVFSIKAHCEGLEIIDGLEDGSHELLVLIDSNDRTYNEIGEGKIKEKIKGESKVAFSFSPTHISAKENTKQWSNFGWRSATSGQWSLDVNDLTGDLIYTNDMELKGWLAYVILADHVVTHDKCMLKKQ